MATRVMGERGGPGGWAPLPASRRSCRSGSCSAGGRWAGTSGSAGAVMVSAGWTVMVSAGRAAAGGRVATSGWVATTGLVAASGRVMTSGRAATCGWGTASGRAVTSGRPATFAGVPAAAAIAPNVAAGTAGTGAEGRGCTKAGSMAWPRYVRGRCRAVVRARHPPGQGCPLLAGGPGRLRRRVLLLQRRAVLRRRILVFVGVERRAYALLHGVGQH